MALTWILDYDFYLILLVDIPLEAQINVPWSLCFISFPDKALGIRNWEKIAYPGEKSLLELFYTHLKVIYSYKGRLLMLRPLKVVLKAWDKGKRTSETPDTGI